MYVRCIFNKKENAQYLLDISAFPCKIIHYSFSVILYASKEKSDASMSSFMFALPYS